MAEFTLNALFEELRGRFGDAVIRKIRGKYYLSDRPRRTRKKPSPKQLAFRTRFGFASSYAKTIQRDPVRKAFYEPLAKARDLRVRAVAIGDWFNPPKVEAVDLRKYRGRPGDPIQIHATDDAGVLHVTVTVLDASRKTIERGKAELKRGTWVYRPKCTVPRGKQITIEAEAEDRPGHRAKLAAVWPVR